MEFRLLGPLEVRDDRGQVIALPRRQQRALLAALLLRPGSVVSTDRLVDQLWGERPPPSAIGSLQNTVSQLRRHLGAELLRTQPPGYVLDVPVDAVDAGRFEQLLARATSLEAADRASALREALALWRGPALADLGEESWARTEAARLDELRLTAVEERIEAELELGRHGVLVAQLEALAAEHPLRERLWRQLALALYRAGRQADALEACRSARAALDELGLEPSPELRQLERDILQQSPGLAAPEAPAEEAPKAVGGERRVVSVLAGDIAPEDEPEALRATLARVLEAASAAVGRHGGVIERFGPEGLTAVFGAEQSHEDDAFRAVRAAVELQEAARISVGVATGEAILADEPHVAGAAVARAAVLARFGKGVLVDPRTYDLVRAAVTAVGSAPAIRITAVQAGRVDEPGDVPLAGRRPELARLRAAFEAAASERRCVWAVVVGEPGIGKSRLARELVGEIDAKLLHGRCAAYGEGATFAPVVEALAGVDPTGLLGEGDDPALVARRIEELGGDAPRPASLGESYWAVRRVLEALARSGPVVLLLDDVHWAEPGLLDLVEYLAARVVDAPLLVLSLARPELLAERPAWAADALRLEPLTEAETRELVAAAAEVEQESREQIVALAEGNPLYAQQLAAFAAESGKALEPGAMPATLGAVLAGRLGRLEAGERATLQRAAVVGREFTRGAVAGIAPPDLAVDAHLLALTRRGFVHAVADPGSTDDAYRFHHVLLRDAAYATLTKEHRAELHERAAAWLDRDGQGDDALVGYHLEQAARLRRELGDPADDLAAAAGDRLATAGLRARFRNDGLAALGLLERAVQLLPTGAGRAEAGFHLSMVLQAAGRAGESGAALEAALEDSLAAGERSLEVQARLETARRAHIQGDLAPDELLERAREAITALEAAGDEHGAARAWMTISDAHSVRCEMEAMGRAAEEAYRRYRIVGFPTQVALAAQAASLYYGPRPVEDAEREARRLLGLTADRAAEAAVSAFLGGLHAMAGGFEEARRLAAFARDVYLDLGSVRSFEVDLAPILMEVERLAGDLDAAATIGRRSVDALIGFGARAHAATRAAQLADLEIGRGDVSEAARLLRIARDNAVADDTLTQFIAGAVEARVLAHRGRHDEAAVLAREAVRSAGATDALADRVRTLVALSDVMRLAGDPGEAREAAAEAERLLAEKGSSAGIARLREQLAAASPA